MSLGRRLDPAPACTHDQVDDVERKSQATSVARIAWTALHRLKDPTDEFVRNGRAVVAHRDDYLGCLPTRRNPNRLPSEPCCAAFPMRLVLAGWSGIIAAVGTVNCAWSRRAHRSPASATVSHSATRRRRSSISNGFVRTGQPIAASGSSASASALPVTKATRGARAGRWMPIQS